DAAVEETASSTTEPTTDPIALTETETGAVNVASKPVEKTNDDDDFIKQLLAEVDKDASAADPLTTTTTETATTTTATTEPAVETNKVDLDSILNPKPATSVDVATTETNIDTIIPPVVSTTPVTETPVVAPKEEVASTVASKTSAEDKGLVPNPEALVVKTEPTTDTLPLIISSQPAAKEIVEVEKPAVTTKKGQMVIVIKRNASMGVDNDVVAKAYLGDVYTVTKTNGEFLWVPKVGGWINKADVAPYTGGKISSF
ncbi:MAG: hypothetical protein CMJ78_02060, partial [Planctomycetaceae bacterium]|nr:hypothetical protein [Planctomycetaceae bacterium]